MTSYRWTPEDKKLIADLAFDLLLTEASKEKWLVSRYALATDIADALEADESLGPRSESKHSLLVDIRYGYVDRVDENKLERVLKRDDRFVVQEHENRSGSRSRGRAVYFLLASELAGVQRRQAEAEAVQARANGIAEQVQEWIEGRLGSGDQGVRFIGGEEIHFFVGHDDEGDLVIEARTEADERSYQLRLVRTPRKAVAS